MPVYKEKNKKKWTKDGRSYYFATYYTDIYGNRKKYISKMYMKASEAKEAEREFLNKNKTHDNINYNIKFEIIFNEWLNYEKTMLKSGTFYRMKTVVNKNILIFFKNIKLFDINVNMLLNWKQKIQNKKVTQKHKNLIIGYMQSILDYSIDNYNFPKKIRNKLQKNKIEIIETKKTSSKNNFWTYEEFQKFINTVNNTFYYTIFNFMYFTGVRYGEMNALTWNDIDFNKKTLTINKNLNFRVEGGGYIITTPKTENSIRTIDLDDELIGLLKKHFELESKIYNFNKSMFVFGNIRYFPATTFRENLNRYIKKANVKKITPHGFRHSHASLLINLGCDSRDVAERLGDTVQMVEKTYYHMFPEKKKKTIEILNNLKNSR